MKVADLIKQFDLTLAAGENGMDRLVKGGYCGDLLSEIMANAPVGCVWLTIQVHQNIVAVAVLREMAAIILVCDNYPDEETKARADEEGIPILVTSLDSFSLAGRFHAAGVVNDTG